MTYITKYSRCHYTSLGIVNLSETIATCRKVLPIRRKAHATDDAVKKQFEYKLSQKKKDPAYLSCLRACMRFTSSVFLIFGLNAADQSCPRLSNSGDTRYGSKLSRNTLDGKPAVMGTDRAAGRRMRHIRRKN